MATPKNATPTDPEAVGDGAFCRVCWCYLVTVPDDDEGHRWVHEDTGLVSCPPGVSRNRPIRMTDSMYAAAMRVAKWRGESLAGVVRRMLQSYVMAGEAEMRAAGKIRKRRVSR